MEEELRQRVIEKLQKGEELTAEWARYLFPPEKREYELVYYGKEREEDILANTLAVPLQPIRTFGNNGEGWHNMLIFGDNLQVMKSLLEMKKAGKLCNADGTAGVRLVYIDPPFATKQEFRGSQDQKAYQDKLAGARFLEFLRKRLVFLRELLSEDGSIYVHLDWKKGHYVKTIIDEVFGEQNFLNEVVWYYRRWNIATNLFARNHDCILFYARNTGKHTFNNLYIPKSEKSSAQGKAWKSVIGEDGIRRSILTGEATKGVPMPDTWQISIINPVGLERTEIGYPTQKPEALLERIIKASSNPGDLVLDCFAGSGTTLAVAEKFGRRWIGVDCGKLAIYTMQKRLLNISESKDLDDPQKKKKYGKACKPFTLYNAGLYDFSKLKELPWVSWRFFALQLFQCRDEPHKIGGVQFDGYLKGASVLVFNHTKNPGARFTEETLEEIHEAVGKRVGNKMFIIAPALTFDFQQDYIDLDGVRYYALRIPYSIINELHQREFTALKQPSDEMAVNDTVEAVGFDFIRTPELKFKCGADKRKGDKPDGGIIKIQTFKSEAVVREPLRKKGNLETLSMVMLDYDYDGEVFDLDAVFYADALAKADWEVRFPLESLGAKLMAVFIDIYGNEARVVLDADEFGVKAGKKTDKKGATK